MYKTNKRNLLCIFPIIIGLVLGVAVLHLYYKSIGGWECLWGKEMLGEIQSLQYKSSAYMVYLLKIRGLQIGFIIAMYYLQKRELAAFIWGFVTGMGFGFFLYDLCMQFGISGVGGYIFMIFPHYICYFWAYKCLYDIDRKSQKIKALGVVIIGIALECYVNPTFLKIFSKIFY